MATKKKVTNSKAKKEAPKKASTEKKTEVTAVTEVKVVKETVVKNPIGDFCKELFARKYDKAENITTIFKKPSIYGGFLTELLGTALLTTFFLLIGTNNPIMTMLFVLGLALAAHGLSGAHFNPLITAGMMTTRRISVSRGILYILAQILGAWAGYLLVTTFAAAGGDEALKALKTMAKLGDNIGLVVLLELIGAMIIGFFFSRAMFYKKHVFIFAATVAAGLTVASLVALLLSSYSQLANSFILNPAVALTYQILPSSGTNFSEVMQGVGAALGVYFAIPVVGGTIGFYLSDIITKLTKATEA